MSSVVAFDDTIAADGSLVILTEVVDGPAGMFAAFLLRAATFKTCDVTLRHSQFVVVVQSELCYKRHARL